MSRLTRDQERAKHAYTQAKEASEGKDFKSYKVLVNSLGPNVIRSGLAGALSFVQRYKATGPREQFGRDLATGFPSSIDMGRGDLESMVEKVHEMDVDTYMLATRECLKLTLWFKRATQAYSAHEEGGA